MSDRLVRIADDQESGDDIGVGWGVAAHAAPLPAMRVLLTFIAGQERLCAAVVKIMIGV